MYYIVNIDVLLFLRFPHSILYSFFHVLVIYVYRCLGHFSNFSYNLKLYESELPLLNLLNSKRNIWNLLLVSLFQLLRSAGYWVTGVWNSFPILRLLKNEHMQITIQRNSKKKKKSRSISPTTIKMCIIRWLANLIMVFT